MKNRVICRVVSVLFAVVAISSAFSICVNAADDFSESITYVMPRLNNGASVDYGFAITSDGVAYVSAVVAGTSGLTQQITIEIQLQRKTLLWWSDVDNGYWTDSFDGTYGSISEHLQLSKTGKYRAVFTITVSGTGGANDVIEETLTYEY